MNRTDIEPGGVYSKVSFRDSRQGWPVMILSTLSYRKDYRTDLVTPAGTTRLANLSYSKRQAAVGLVAVHLAFSMNEGEDVLAFRAKVKRLRELVSVEAGVEALNKSAVKSWDDREHLAVKDADGTLLGTYELLTSLVLVPGDYVALTLAERRSAAEREHYASEAEKSRVADVQRYNELADRLDRLGITGYHAADWESPHGRFDKLTFDDLDMLIVGAENFYHEYHDAHPKYPDGWPKKSS